MSTEIYVPAMWMCALLNVLKYTGYRTIKTTKIYLKGHSVAICQYVEFMEMREKTGKKK